MRGRAGLAAGAVLAGCLGSAILAQPALATPRHSALSARAQVRPWPITVTIRTVPPLAGVRFSFDGQPFTTGANGEALVTKQHNFGPHTLTLVDTRLTRPGRHYGFARWAGQRDPDQAFVPTVHGLPMRANYTVTAGFATWCPVSPHFTYQQGRALDPARISLVTVRSDAGRDATLRPAGRTWLQCQQPLYRGSTLTIHPMRYSLQSVIVSGTNVVQAGVERFQPDRDPGPTIVGYFHDLTITAHDALFGGPTGDVALVTLPDHRVRRVPLGAGHSVNLSELPQGNYKVSVKAGGAIVSAWSMRLARDQKVDLIAVTPLDLATVGGVLVVAVIGLPLLSGPRRRQLRGLLRRSAMGRMPQRERHVWREPSA